MKPAEKSLLRKVARLFRRHRAGILATWLDLIRRNRIIPGEDESVIFGDAFRTLLDDFIRHLGRGKPRDYYARNAVVARTIAMNDISFPLFIKAFHLFEESYGPLFRRELARAEHFEVIDTLDKLHHNTIAIVANEYLAVKDFTVYALARLAELRDPETADHLERTRQFSAILARGLKLPSGFVDQIYRVGPLHDIGKVGIPDAILLKPGPLTRDEWTVMKQHSVLGSDAIRQIIGRQKVTRGYLMMGYEIVRHHHERWDGCGYPDGLRGDAIPLAARIFALVDAYDAITSKRPYKPALSHAEAVRRLRADRGTHFDPAMIDVFVKVQREFQAVARKYRDG